MTSQASQVDVSDIPEPAMAGGKEKRQHATTTTTTTTTTSPSPATVPPSPEYPRFHRVVTALFYAVCATLIVIVNKLVLTSYQFPSFLALALGQMIVTVVILLVLRTMGVVHFPKPHRDIFKQVWPLPILFFGSIVFSLGGTKRLSLPMYIALRRFSNLFILWGEYFILGVTATRFIQSSVYMMILGALIAASNDLAFDATGYAFLMFTNVCSSASGVFTKQKLNMKELGTYGLMFYNCLIMVVPTFLLTYYTGDLRKTMEFDHWHEPMFTVQILMACLMGFLVNYSTMLCTMYNSALTTSIVGVIKNLFITYVGMFIGGDYVYSFINFVGINVSVVGGLMYTHATFSAKQRVPLTGSLSKV